MLKVTNNHIHKFRVIKKKFLKKTRVPKPDNWKRMTSNQIWLRFVIQVIVVGSSRPAEVFNSSARLKRSVSYHRLTKMKDENEVKKSIHRVLREVGTRYVNRKTEALTHNLKILKGFKAGPRGLLKRIAEFTGRNESKRKVRYLMKIFQYVKSKGARDMLMGLGLVRDAIALDVRVQKVLEKVCIKLPKGFASQPDIYDEIETDLISKLCKPLKISGIQFDRMIYQNYDEIMQMEC